MSKQEIFLSYSRRANSEEAKELRTALQGEGFSVWWDKKILPGQDWRHEVSNAMKRCGAFVLCLSKEVEAMEVSEIYSEARDAIEIYRTYRPGEIYLIPVRFSECKIPDIEIDATRKLDRLQYVDLFPEEKYQVGLNLLVASLQVALKDTVSYMDEREAFADARETEIEITINRDIRAFRKEEQDRLIRAFGEFLELGSIRLIKKQGGSVKLTLALPLNHAKKLFWAIKAGKFDEYDVVHVHSEEIQDPEANLVTPAEGEPTMTEKAQEKTNGRVSHPQEIPQAYCLFTHYGKLKKYPDLGRAQGKRTRFGFEDYVQVDRERAKLQGYVLEMRQDLIYLNELLSPTEQGDRGFAFVFIEALWHELLDEMTENDGEVSRETIERMNRLDEMIDVVRIFDRIRVVTAKNMHELLKTLYDRSEYFRRNLAVALGASGTRLFYDGPKLIEAAIRIANMGRGIPILRFDDDVLFYGARIGGAITDEKKRDILKRQQTSIRSLCKAYHELSNDPIVSCFVISGHYGGTIQEKTQEAFINSFATRIAQLADIPDNSLADWTFDTEKKRLTDPATISPDYCRTFLRKIGLVGANPFGQVVSGAGMCLSDTAILDLPPFSNMRQNVMWIDDHLKWSLHHDLRHFGYLRSMTSRITQIEEAVFLQERYNSNRPIDLSDVQWHLQNYMIRLLMGCVVDKWLRGTADLKKTRSELSDIVWEKKIPEWMKLQMLPASYALMLQAVLLRGWGKAPEIETGVASARNQFKNKLWREGIVRLREFVNEFTGDRENKSLFPDTFLDLYLYGYGSDYSRLEKSLQTLSEGDEKEKKTLLPDYLAEKGLVGAVEELEELMKKEDSELVELLDDRSIEIPAGREFVPKSLNEALVVLVNDFVNYIDFVVSWKDFVQATRCILNIKGAYREVIWLMFGNRGEIP